jgi:hypothetical protein
MAKKSKIGFDAIGNIAVKAAGFGGRSIGSGDKLGKKTMKKRSF